MIILDASVVLKWFIPDEAQRDNAIKVLDFLVDHPDAFAAPDLLFIETAAVFARAKGITLAQRQQYVTYLEELGINRIRTGHEVLSTALELADRWGLSGYDCIYLATATLLHGQWLTADERAIKRVRAKELAIPLASWRR
jgi:predicted nucleic acid-binding protein